MKKKKREEKKSEKKKKQFFEQQFTPLYLAPPFFSLLLNDEHQQFPLFFLFSLNRWRSASSCWDHVTIYFSHRLGVPGILSIATHGLEVAGYDLIHELIPF